MTQITLYRANLAGSWVSHALLRHLSIPFEAVPLRSRPDGRYEAADGSFTHEEYCQNVNPGGYVPSLAVDGEVITETPAVLTMIAQLAPDRAAGAAMLGRTPLERARVLEWLVWLAGTLQMAGFKAYWRAGRFVDGHADALPAIREKGRRVIEAGFARIEERLRGRRYAVGDAPTVVDINLYLFWVWGHFAEIPMGERFPAWAEVLRRAVALPGVREAAEDEGMTLYF
ncbi:glutathione S-transferase [Biscogniauxia sp. FL1348]|nr:glutathione S-transferase [Biscogniauxia sp. FL1348]